MTSAHCTSRCQSRTFGTNPSAISRSFSSSMQYRTSWPSFATCHAMSLISPVIETKRNLRLSPFIEPRSGAAGLCMRRRRLVASYNCVTLARGLIEMLLQNPDSIIVLFKLTKRERDTAALRRWLSYPAAREADSIATHGGKHEPLDTSEIERLCKRFTKIESKRDVAHLPRQSNNGAYRRKRLRTARLPTSKEVAINTSSVISQNLADAQ